MSDDIRIQRLIRAAGVQRSAELGIAIGEFLATSWLGAAEAARKAAAALRGPKDGPVRTGGALPLPTR